MGYCTFRSTPVHRRKTMSPFKSTEQTIMTINFKFFSCKIIHKRLDFRTQDLLAARRLCFEIIQIRYGKASAPIKACFHNMTPGKEDAIKSTIQLVQRWEMDNMQILKAPCTSLTNNKGVLQHLMDCHQVKPGQYLFLKISWVQNSLPTSLDINFVWFPGNKGIRGNNAEDMLAKEATKRNMTPDRMLPAGVTKLVSMLLANFQLVSKKDCLAHISALPRAPFSLINQLLSGHSPLHQHLFKAERCLDPRCPFCQARETTIHLFNFCPKYKYKQKLWELIKQARKAKIRVEPN
ncbi:uncharacterized protein VP01_1030g3 [Puccinia sorghi]|uniref:RNase H type-1 domain-containing protein n=1 Tax=Puccinia sorghi TaxID=27349 RepID=A0A0L6VUU2_9BASI|nr:uncharacterized protein VP01_1030g3 [Puccinia sorghi]